MSIVDTTVASVCKALDSQKVLKLSNKKECKAKGKHSVSHVSYRVWGDLRVEDLESILTRLQFKLDQPLRWFTESAGVALQMAASVSFFRKLGCGQGVRAECRVLHSGLIVLQIQGEF